MISIVIPAYNLHETTRDCLTAVRLHTSDCEILLVDNGSDPPYEKPYTGFIPCTLIRNETNRGFPEAVNQGIAAAQGDVIILLNNDVIVTPGWAEKLAAALGHYDIVGPVTNYCAGMQRVMVEPYEDEAELAKAAQAWAEEWQDAITPVRWVIGFCMAFRRDVVEAVGPFDATHWPCCGEEVDFCLRARAEGYAVGIVHGCYVHHWGSQTFKLLDSAHPYDDIVTRNNDYLTARWGPEWTEQAADAHPVPRGLCVNLGSGYRPLDGFVNVDNRPQCKPDVLCDVIAGLPWEDSSVSLVRADDFLEHIPSEHVLAVMTDIWRVLKPDGILDASVPSTDGRGAFQDPTHRSFWNRNTWRYFSEAHHRQLYDIAADFVIESLTENEPDADGIIHTHVLARARK